MNLNKLLELFSERNGVLSHTKIISLVSSFCLFCAFIYGIVKGTSLSVDYWWILVALIFNRVPNKFLENKNEK